MYKMGNTIINAVIVEDSEINRKTLKKMLGAYCEEVSIIGEAATIEDAYMTIKEVEPDLVFLDIQMKKGTTFDLLKRLHDESSIDFDIIFVTAYGMFEYATKALEYAALDFITKPIDKDKLIVAVNKAKSKIGKNSQKQQVALLLENLSQLNSKSRKIAIHMPKGIIEFVPVEEILYLEADGVVTHVFLEPNGKKITAMKNLGNYGKLLINDYNFFQISNSCVVNLDYVKRYNHSELTLTFSNGMSVFASRRGGQDFKKYLNQKSDLNDKILPSKSFLNILKRLVR